MCLYTNFVVVRTLLKQGTAVVYSSRFLVLALNALAGTKTALSAYMYLGSYIACISLHSSVCIPWASADGVVPA